MTTAVENGHGPSQTPTVDPSENPLHRLTPEQIEAIGKEFDQLHEQVKADLGDRDATYIRSMIAFQRRLALFGRAELIASRWRASRNSRDTEIFKFGLALTRASGEVQSSSSSIENSI